MTGTWFSGWATGDIVTAAEFRKGIGSLYDTTLGAAAAQIDVTGIPATYAHLMLMLYARADATGPAFVNALMRLNNDTSANYDYELMQCGGTAINAAEWFAQTGSWVGYIPDASAAANLFGTAMIQIPHYTNAVNNKAIISAAGYKTGGATGSMGSVLASTHWRSNAAVNRLTLFLSAGNFVAGTRLTLYAMGA